MKHTIRSYYERVKEGENQIDIFKRDGFKNNLTNLLSSTEDSLTITIDADWGEGKTTFIKLWHDNLESSDQFIPIYYNAFKNDFASDAFISIAVTIQEAIKKHYKKHNLNQDQENLIEEYTKVAKELGIELAKMGTNLTVKLATGGLIQANTIWDIFSDKTKELKKRENKSLISEKYDAFLNRRETIREYQVALEKLLKVGSENENRRVVFFVDELDRCRPDFAIQVLEKIKHLFSVSNVNFILTINRKQLVEIIKHTYGVNEDDAQLYLHKFVHIETKLPTLKDLRTTSEQNLKLFIECLVKAFNIPNELFDTDGFYNLILKSMPKIDYTPRSIERAITLYTISISSCDEKKAKHLFRHVLLLSLLKVHARPIFDDAKGNERILKNISRINIELGQNFINYLGAEKYFGPGVTTLSSNQVKIKNLKEAAKIVDMYDLPPKPSKNNDSIEEILTHRVPPNFYKED